MFSEWVFNNIEDLSSVCQLVHNEKVTALFELKLSPGLVGNQLFLLQNGKVIDLKTHQVFSEHKDAKEENIERLLDELECHRQFMVGEKRFLEGNQLVNAIKSPEKNTAQRAMKSRRLLSPLFCSDVNNQDFLLQAYEI